MTDHLSSSMRSTWDTLAQRDALHFIATERTDWDLESFLSSGRQTIARLLDSVLHQPQGVALDLGCGVGRLTLALADHCDHVYGLDVSPEMIRRANQIKVDLAKTNVDFLCNNGRDLSSIPSASCDLALSYIVLQHLPDPRLVSGYIRELGRVVKPGGHVLFHVPVYRASALVTPWRATQRLFRGLLSPLESLGLMPPEKGRAFRGSRLRLAEVETGLADAALTPLSLQRLPSAYRLCDDAIVYAIKA